MVVVLRFAHGHNTTMGDFTLYVLELDSGVGNAEFVVEHFLHVP